MSSKRIINENLKINTKTSSIFSAQNSKFFTLTSKNNANINPLQISNKSILTSQSKNENKRKIIFNPSKIPKIKFSSPSLRLNYNNNSLSPIKVNEIQPQDLLKENKILRDQIQRLLIENKVLKQENKTYRELYQSSSNLNTLRNNSIRDTERINLKKKKTQKFFSEQFGTQYQLGFFAKKQQRSGSIIVKDPNYNSTNNINNSLSNNNTIESSNINHRNTINSFLLKESRSSNMNYIKSNSDKGEVKITSNNNTNGDKDVNSISSLQAYGGTSMTINSSMNKIEEDYEVNYKSTFNRAKTVLEKYNSLINSILESNK